MPYGAVAERDLYVKVFLTQVINTNWTNICDCRLLLEDKRIGYDEVAKPHIDYYTYSYSPTSSVSVKILKGTRSADFSIATPKAQYDNATLIGYSVSDSRYK